MLSYILDNGGLKILIRELVRHPKDGLYIAGLAVAEKGISELNAEGYCDIRHDVARNVARMRLNGMKNCYVNMLEEYLDKGCPLHLPFYLDDGE